MFYGLLLFINGKRPYFDTPDDEGGTVLGHSNESRIDDFVVVGGGGHGAKIERVNYQNVRIIQINAENGKTE